jgi:hypothetical protein
MKLSASLPMALLAMLFMVPASAQLKAPRDAQAAAPVQPAASGNADSAIAEKETAGKLAAAGWLVLLDRRDWGRAWETSSAVFRGSVPLAAWMDAIPKVRQPLGAFVERSPATSAYKTTLAGRPDGEYVTVVFASKFDNKEVQEVVTTVRDPDGKWRVTGYSPQ